MIKFEWCNWFRYFSFHGHRSYHSSMTNCERLTKDLEGFKWQWKEKFDKDSLSLTVVVGSKARIETRIKSAKSSKLGPFKNTRIVPTLVCPSPKFVQNISKVKNFLSANALLDNVWTKIEFPGVKSVQWPQVWTGSLLTLDRDGTDLVLCMSLDRHLTEFWQSLDKDWIFCPISVQPPYVKEHPNSDADSRPQRQMREEVRGPSTEGVPHAADPVRTHRDQAQRKDGRHVVRGKSTEICSALL